MPIKKSTLCRTHFVLILLLLCGLVFCISCGEPQSDECAQYIQCRRWFEAVFNRPEKQLHVYEPDGICWENEELASDCSQACTDERRALHEKLTDAGEAKIRTRLSHPFSRSRTLFFLHNRTHGDTRSSFWL